MMISTGERMLFCSIFSDGTLHAAKIMDFALKDGDVFYLVENHSNKIWLTAKQLIGPIDLMEAYFVNYIDKLERKQAKPKRFRN